MSTPIDPISVDDLKIFDWQQIIADAEEKDCREYNRLFVEKAQQYGQAGDTKAQQICGIMAGLTSFAFDLDNPRDPFKPQWVWYSDGTRRLTTSSFHENVRDVLLGIVDEIHDAEMKARVADVLWTLRKGGYPVATLAVNAYLESAKILEHPEEWVEGALRIERALQISASLGKTNTNFITTIAYIEEVLDRLDGNDPLWFSFKLMSLLFEFKQGNTDKYAALASKIAKAAEGNSFWRRARDYWGMAAKWYTRKDGEDADTVYEAQFNAAETYVKEAEVWLGLNPPSYKNASRELVYAVEYLRKINAPRERIKEVHRKLLECQDKDDDFNQASASIDLSRYVQQAIDAVKDKPLCEAILILASNYRPTKVTTLRDQVLTQRAKNPIYFWVSAQQLNYRGRVTASRPSLYSDNQDDTERAIQAEMHRQAVYYREVYAQGWVVPVVNQINQEHYVRLNDLAEFVDNNPFIPPGHEFTYLRGLYAGLTGDFHLATHLLLPQVENSLRHLLEQLGEVVSKIDSQGIQDEMHLGELLYIAKLEELFDEDVLFDLRGVLVNRFGSNLRNYAMHGMLNDGAFSSLTAIYFWWLTLWLCCYPAFTKETATSQAEEVPREASSPSSENIDLLDNDEASV